MCGCEEFSGSVVGECVCVGTIDKQLRKVYSHDCLSRSQAVAKDDITNLLKVSTRHMVATSNLARMIWWQTSQLLKAASNHG